MSVYVIGDIHGCFDALTALLKEIRFDPVHDQLWLTGDLVNRGKDSLAVVSFLMDLPEASVRCVLGNHDIYALMCWSGIKLVDQDNILSDLIASEDCMQWLLRQPLLVSDGHDHLVHAGFLPNFSLAQLAQMAREVESILRSYDYVSFFKPLYRVNETVWRDDFDALSRFRFTLNMFTRLRYCSYDGEMNFFYKNTSADLPDHWVPWFRAYPLPVGQRVFFGHWSDLGLLITNQYYCLDSGCVWGRELSAFRKEDGRLFQV